MYHFQKIENLVGNDERQFVHQTIGMDNIVFPTLTEKVKGLLDPDSREVLEEIGLPGTNIETLTQNEMGFCAAKEPFIIEVDAASIGPVRDRSSTFICLSELYTNVTSCIDTSYDYNLTLLDQTKRRAKLLPIASSIRRQIVAVAAYLHHFRATQGLSREDTRVLNDQFFENVLTYVGTTDASESFWSRVWEVHEFA